MFSGLQDGVNHGSTDPRGMDDTRGHDLLAWMGLLFRVHSGNLPCSDPLRTVPVPYLLSQALMKGQSRGFGACIAHGLSKTDETGHTSQRDYVTMILLDHAWQKLFNGPEVR